MADKKALLVIDMQNDYLWAERKPMFSYDTERLVRSVNETIAQHKASGDDIIYIGQVFPNIVTNRLIIGFSIKGTEGAELYSGLDVVSHLYFEKNLPNTFTSKSFKEYLSKNKYITFTVCGLDLCGCVGATAKGALRTGAKVFLDEKSTGCRFSAEKAQKRKSELIRKGVKFI
ncbi:isochorismatase family cysteine hydrolase [Ruminococcus albus]|uniref:Nicotinamidase-related amidase n=1 Tax=Ruminococcus albus TaxID=1264 RepID=A0A1H7NBI6_RUMAL|nr:isochorismatase family cysteine hydrolase [Ruminococcus albus]SEL20328.1 Nicotinamidase-related amidase [Ruminococcus albus]